LKYTIWTGTTLFFYHMYLIKRTNKPENGFLANENFLNFAKVVDYMFYDLKLLLTRPPVEKFLLDRPDIPGAVFPKVLILNMRGTLIHQEYKVRLLI